MLKTHYDGLSSSQVEESKKKYGTNSLSEMETETFWDKLKENFQDPIIKILVVALIIDVAFYFFDQVEWFEPLGIAIAVLIATLVGTYSEYSNEQSFQKLQEEASRIKCKVYRNGNIGEIFINDIVKGDLILVQTGDKIPIDGVLVDGHVSVDQSVLNGESKEAEKHIPKEDYKYEDGNSDFLDESKIFRGTVVVEGEAIVEAKTIGDSSFYGQLAKELQAEDRESPLKVKLGHLADGISKFGYIGGSLIAASFMFKKIVLNSMAAGTPIAAYFSNIPQAVNDLVTAIILAIIIIVVAVPEGLPMMIAMVLSLNMKKLLKDNILVRKLIGIETAGSLNILFSDKTGTITKGLLEVILFCDGENNQYDSYNNVPGKLNRMMDLSIAENTSAVLNIQDDGTYKVLGGNSTERALLKFASEKVIDYDLETVDNIPFNSKDKFSATQVKGEYNLTLVKGAPEKIIEACTTYYDKEGNKQAFGKEKLTNINNKINELADRAIRVLAIATSDKPIGEDIFNELTFVGIVGIRDDLREESVQAIGEAMDAGIQVVMITGDRKETAVAIAKEAGLIKNDTDIVLTSNELKELSDEKLKKMIPNIRVIARALPTDKSRLVKLAQDLDLVVGMTGDGVNDSPALKKADVGFAMGSGTEVAKEAGDIVILDDNFNSIAKTVLYGRTIYNSIRKFIVYQLTVNVGAILIAFIGPFIGVDLPLSMTQMLWVNLVMDTLAALSFGGEAALKKYMKEKPKSRKEAIINKDMWSSILINGGLVATLSVLFLKLDVFRNIFRIGPTGKEDIYFLTGFFSFFIFLNVFNMFNARTVELNLFEHIRDNKGFLKVVGVIVVVQIIMAYIGGDILRTAGLTLREWLIITALALIIIPVDLIRKAIRNAMRAKA
ncbi:calcium-translocating P-type ATPase, PMCA-type [Abyssisolibacter fermentans]|uniref:calcium-translocating P-type ATPase, PMCA-type n=1 Tax=Abyssisolibacter fermentans TaxID=1766203 RepID=UPI000837A91C|nr:calcium-translocating P-type ATPase, PMCA-type [Abyssisolibacter fermentans]